MKPELFKIAISQDVLDRIQSKLNNATIDPLPADAGWAKGTNIRYMQ
jgi:hypothetical protein